MYCEMRNVAIINSCNNGSTGKIAIGLYNKLDSEGYNTKFFYGTGTEPQNSNHIKFESWLEIRMHIFFARLTGYHGEFSQWATSRLLKKIKQLDIDTIFLLSVHGFYINERRLLNFIAEKGIRLVYIMIDEYAYLGNCCGDKGCKKFRNGCGNCPSISSYPSSWFFDRSAHIFKRKEKNYKKLKNATFVGPEYTIVRAKESPLSQFMQFQILDEAINLSLYKPTNSEVLREELGIAKDTIIIGTVASTNTSSKGARFFIEMASHFANQDKYVFVHVGYKLPNKADLPSNYIAIDYVKEDADLVKYYSLYDLFVFPSLMDTMSNACLEALACGTPLLCFNISGMPYLMDNTVGTLVPAKDVHAMIDVVSNTTKKTDKTIDTCRKYAERRFDINKYSDNLIEIALQRVVESNET